MVASRRGFHELVEKATSPLLPSGHEDISINFEICDMIRSKAVTPHKAMLELKTRVEHTNPNVQILALGLSDMCIKNSGPLFLEEIASPTFMDTITSVLRERPHLAPPVKTKILQCLQDWKHFAEARPKELGYIKEVVRELEQQGYELPPPDPNAVAAASVLTETLVAPDKTMPLPWYSIEEPVRVCDGCAKRKAPVSATRTAATAPAAAAPDQNEEQDGDLSRAIALSLQEQAHSHAVNRNETMGRGEGCDAEEDPDLAAAIAASLKDWEEQQQKESTNSEAPIASAPLPVSDARMRSYPQRTLEVDTMDLDHILTFAQTVTQPGGAWKQAVPTQGLPQPIQNMQDKASASRGRLVRQLDLGHRRLRELTTLHDKLVEVVNMYDKLLDAQWASPMTIYPAGPAQRSSSTALPGPAPMAPADPSFPGPSAPSAPYLPDLSYTRESLTNPTIPLYHISPEPGRNSVPIHESVPPPQEEALLIDL
ncbi:Vacuolar protein-sorting-associated protein 27 [Malassezia nana]|uniref:Vacuolar protein-sorting-associated protein 27 n=1 Tax=Malassezia nana TaxID=180528 RepID=A0AAF0J237_9BASI|nr:Vacuolar protein-sorting-associated protein 27 [Malassezia nana]